MLINIAYSTSIYMLIVALSHSHDIFVVRDSSRQKHSTHNYFAFLDATIIYMVEQLNPEYERRLRV